MKYASLVLFSRPWGTLAASSALLLTLATIPAVIADPTGGVFAIQQAGGAR